MPPLKLPPRKPSGRPSLTPWVGSRREHPNPATAQVSDALIGAGIAPGVLEVSQSRTPTGLEADAIEAAVLQGGDCVIGQVRDGAVAVTVLPVLASGKCFVGT